MSNTTRVKLNYVATM